LVRHVQTEFNLANRYQGPMGSPMSEAGRPQASRNGHILANLILGIDAYKIVSSPLGRTMQAAKLICTEVGAERVDADARLVEHGYGELEGLLRDQVTPNEARNGRPAKLNLWNYAMPGGESYRMVAEHVKSWLDDVR